MRFQNVQAILAAAVAFQFGIAQAASPGLGAPIIGTVLAKGSFRLDNATVAGNATLFDGGTLETAAASSSVELSSGTRMTLGAGSRGRIFGDHVVLERGESRTDKAAGFHIEARGLRVIPETGSTSARVHLVGANTVEVATLTGSLRVLNSRGALVAELPQGAALAFEPQNSSNLSARISGCLENRGGHYVLTDETTNVSVELLGTGLNKDVGYRVEVSGSTDAAATPISSASQIIRVAEIKRLSRSCTAAAGAGGAAGTRGAAGGGSSGIAISGTAIAIIGGVSAAAVVGGLAAAGSLSQGGGTVSR